MCTIGLILGIVAGVLLHRSVTFIPLLLLISVVLSLCHFIQKISNTLAIAILFLSCAIGIHQGYVTPQHIPERFMPLLGTKVVLNGTVVAMPDIRETKDRLTIEITDGNEHTRFIAAVPLQLRVSVGDVIQVTGMLKEPQPFDTDGGRTFLYDKFLAKDGIFGIMSNAHGKVVGKSSSHWLQLLHVLEAMKEKSITAINACVQKPENALAVGILIGGKQGLGTDLMDAFTISGMLQIVVLSGYNVMIVAEAILLALQPLPKKCALLFAGIAIVLFVLLAGAGSSAVRAGLMAIFGLGARIAGRAHEVIRVLFLTLAIMAFANPFSLVYDPSLQFSFLATFGLIIGTPVITRLLLVIPNVFIRELFVTTIAAQLGVLPILLWQTGNLSLVSLFANAISMPVIPFAMAASAVAGIFAFVVGTAHPVILSAASFPATLLLWYVIRVATFSASVPYAHVILPAFSFWFVIVSYACLGIGTWWYAKTVARSKELATVSRAPNTSNSLVHYDVTASRKRRSTEDQSRLSKNASTYDFFSAGT